MTAPSTQESKAKSNQEKEASQAQQGVRQLEDGTRAVARGTALSATTLLPPAFFQPTLLIDATFNIAIAMLTFQRDFLKDVLYTGRQADVR